ncbi:MAG TPA: polyhydroxyalkanoate synthesis regulator DNA-binding domain-containing protein [Thermotogota bacterium]|nr:polyhydroxyalkanoate synthesis regulator DNA-binding domain-containing protein [Thermotogota bacterium]
MIKQVIMGQNFVGGRHLRIIKKYKNRKLYDSDSRKFIRLKDIFNMINNGEKLKILNHLGEDVTFDVISKAKFNSSTYVPIDRQYFHQVINSIEKLLKGDAEEFSEILFKLVDEKIIDGQYARNLGISIISQMGAKHDVNEEDVVQFFKDCGMVSEEEYDELKRENETLRLEADDRVKREGLVRQFWQYINDAEFDRLHQVMEDSAIIRLPNTREVFIGTEKYICFNRKYPGRWFAEVETLYPSDKKLISIVNVHDEGETARFIVMSVFSFSDDRISEISEYWSDNGEPPQWRLDERLSERY